MVHRRITHRLISLISPSSVALASVAGTGVSVAFSSYDDAGYALFAQAFREKL